MTFIINNKLNKGRIPWNKGKPLSDAHKKKISDSHIGIQTTGMLGKHHSESTKEKLRLQKVGIKHTLEHTQKIREANSGSRCYKWIKDRSKVIKSDRNFHDSEYKQWRKNICNRDNWKCKIENSDCNGRLEVHHILSWKNNPELRYDINNGIALCHFHHPKTRVDEKKLSSFFQHLVAEMISNG